MIGILKKIYSLFYYIVYGRVRYAQKLGVTVGDSCRIYISNWGSEPFLVSIGDRVTITSGVNLLTHDGSTWLVRDDQGRRYQRYAPIRIGSDVFIGVNTIVMPGVSIGSRVVIGAGSVVTKDIPDNSVAVGNPGRVVSSFDQLDAKIRESGVTDSELDGISVYKGRVLRSIELSLKQNGK